VVVVGAEGLFGFADDAAGDEMVKTFHYVRDLTAAETEQSRAAEALLRKVTIGSALSELRAAERSLHEAIEVLEREGGSTPNWHGAGARVQREFKAWLSAFRSFDDRTSAWLSGELGKESEVYREFKRLLSAEFDTNFAYRLCCALRNASEHVDNVINDLRVTASENAEGGGVETLVLLRLDGPRLARDFTRIKPATREELRNCSGPLELEWILGAATLSCERVHCGLLLALWGTLEPAIRLCQSLHDEALANGGGWAIFIPTDSLSGLGQGPAQMTVRYNAKNLGDLALSNRSEGEAILGQPVSPFGAEDFIK
jgi:hypothetical protein